MNACLGVDIRLQVGNNVRKYRQERALSQEELAFKSGLDRTYISGVERGRRNPTVAVLKKIADALGIAPALLLE